MVVTRTHKPAQPKATEAQKREAKRVAAAAERKKATKAARNGNKSPDELESESEDIDEILERIERDQARVAAKKALKVKPSRLSILEAQRAVLEAAIEEEELKSKVPVTPKKKSKPVQLSGDGSKIRALKKARLESEDEDELFNSGASSDPEGSIDEAADAAAGEGKLEKQSILSSYRKVLKGLAKLSQPSMRLALRLLKRSDVDPTSASGQIVLAGFVDELQSITLTARYGAGVAASVRAFSTDSSAGGQISPNFCAKPCPSRKQ